MAEASSASATKSDEEKVEMLDRLLTRLALCDDSNLQPLLSKLLPFTIFSLSSQSSAVRNKVLEILSFSSKYIATERLQFVANGCRRRGKQTGLPQTGWATIRPVKEPEGMLPLEGGQVQSPTLPFSSQQGLNGTASTKSHHSFAANTDGFDDLIR